MYIYTYVNVYINSYINYICIYKNFIYLYKIYIIIYKIHVNICNQFSCCVWLFQELKGNIWPRKVNVFTILASKKKFTGPQSIMHTKRVIYIESVMSN